METVHIDNRIYFTKSGNVSQKQSANQSTIRSFQIHCSLELPHCIRLNSDSTRFELHFVQLFGFIFHFVVFIAIAIFIDGWQICTKPSKKTIRKFLWLSNHYRSNRTKPKPKPFLFIFTSGYSCFFLVFHFVSFSLFTASFIFLKIHFNLFNVTQSLYTTLYKSKLNELQK